MENGAQIQSASAAISVSERLSCGRHHLGVGLGFVDRIVRLREHRHGRGRQKVGMDPQSRHPHRPPLAEHASRWLA